MRTISPNYFRMFAYSFFVTTYIFLLSFYFSHQREATQVPVPIVTAKTETVKSTEKVIHIVDGDTFEIEGRIKVRLIGMDTPEIKGKNKTIDCFAAEAKKRLESLIMGKQVLLVKDVSETDRYGRLLRYVYINDEMVNNTLVKEGYAKAATFPPDVKYAGQFVQSEREARDSALGLWSACK